MRSCDWFLIGGDGFNVKLIFKEFELELEEECGYDFIEVIDGLHNNYPSSLGKFCGNKVRSNLFLITKNFSSKLFSDWGRTNFNGRGFGHQI